MTVPSTAGSQPPAGWRSPQAGMLLVVLFWGANFTALKLTFQQMDPLAMTGLRFLLGTAIMAALVLRSEGSLAVPRTMVGHLVVLGLLGNTFYQLAFVTGLAITSAINSSLILAAMPTVVTLLAGLLRVEPVTRRQVGAVLLASAGVVIVLAARGLGGAQLGSGLGDLLMMAGVLLWSAYTLLMRRWHLSGISSLKLTTWTLITGTPGLVLAGIPGALRTDWTSVTWGGWAGVIYSAVLSLVAAYLLFNRGVRYLGAAGASVFSCLTPLVAALIAVAALGERPTAAHLLGGAMIIGGVLLSRRPHATPTPPEDEAAEVAETAIAE